jgi:hypothetical protein
LKFYKKRPSQAIDKARYNFTMSKRFVFSVLLVGALLGGYFLYRYLHASGARSVQVVRWLRDPEAYPDLEILQGTRCADAPFLLPTDGMIGYLWDDSFRPGHRHQGIDIFGGTAPGVTPVISAYEGYLTRLPAWTSTVIVRVPSDPLHPERQIWLYYTHMANAEGQSFIVDAFPRGSNEIKIPAGTLLGYQGNYSGDPLNPVGVHLHFSIVKDDGYGHFTNELEIENTYDPSPYFGMNLNAKENQNGIPVCEE